MEYYIDDLLVILEKLKAHLEENLDEVIATLESVANGDLPIIETVTPEEAERFRKVCEWILGLGLQNVLNKVERELERPSSAGGDKTICNFIRRSVFPKRLPIADDEIDEQALRRQVVLLMSYIFYDEFHFPQPGIGVYDIANDPFEKLKWVYRYWLNQLEVAEKGSGIEDVFASQDLSELAKSTPAHSGHISFSCAGDLLAVDVLTPENTAHLFDEIVDFYSTTDIVSANLESTVDPKNPIGRHQNTGEAARMNTSVEMFYKFVSKAKINFFSTATNHAIDWDTQGVNATLNVLSASGAKHTGTAKSQAQQDDVTFVKKWPVELPEEEMNEMCVAMIAFTMDLNGFKPEFPYQVNEVRVNDANPAPDYSLIRKQVATARGKGARWIIAYVHWGWEFEMYPHVNIREAAREIIACGVDTILGNHAHVSQPAELIPRPGMQDALVIYSFGDFVSYHPESRNSKLSYIVRFDVTVKYDRYFISGLEALPIYIVNEHVEGTRFNCRIAKFKNVLSDPDAYGLTEIEKKQLPHLRDKVWNKILSPLSQLNPIN